MFIVGVDKPLQKVLSFEVSVMYIFKTGVPTVLGQPTHDAHAFHIATFIQRDI